MCCRLCTFRLKFCQTGGLLKGLIYFVVFFCFYLFFNAFVVYTALFKRPSVVDRVALPCSLLGVWFICVGCKAQERSLSKIIVARPYRTMRRFENSA